MAEISYLQVTRDCNMKCIICSNPPTGYRLDFEQAKEKIDALVENKYREVFLTGGEPTVYSSLPQLIGYCLKKKVVPRIITNGQKIANIKYLQLLKDSGLRHIHLSVYSCYEKIEAKIRKNRNSLKNITRALINLQNLGGITTDINIVINKYNANHLSKVVIWIIDKFSFVNHFVFNNLDPHMNRVENNAEVIPKLNDFELELHTALSILEKYKKTFRVERVPLCYLTDFEHVATETRKIIKVEKRIIYFLDERGEFSQDAWHHKKGKYCEVCSLNKICGGLYAMGKAFEENELYPVFIDPIKIIEKVER